MNKEQIEQCFFKGILIILISVTVLLYGISAHASEYTEPIGMGCTNAFLIDKDCDGFGVASPLGPDADDNDSTVNTAPTVLEKYGNIYNFIKEVKGYNPLNYYFIDVDNGDDNTGNINDQTKPFKSWNAIHTKVKPGDAVIFRGGISNEMIYGDFPPLNGTEENPIILMTYPGELFIIDRVGASIAVRNSSYVILDGFTCMNSETRIGRAIGMGECNNIRFVNIDSGHATSGLFAMQDLKNIEISNCVFHDTDDHSDGTHCVYLGARELPNSDITISDSLFYNCGMHAFQHNGRVTNLTFERNIIHSARMAAIALEMGVSDSVFRNNLTFNNKQGVVIYNYVSTDSSIQPFDQKNNLFINNTFWTGKYNYNDGTIGDHAPETFPSVHFNDRILDDYGEYHLELVRSFDYNVFRNNIFVSHSGPVIRFDQEDYADTIVFENNVIYRYDGSDHTMIYGKTFYNFEEFEKFGDHISNNIYGYPEFENVSVDFYDTPERFSFNYLADSPAIDFGSNLDTPLTDLRGVDRTGFIDAGCYEGSTSTASSPTSPEVSYEEDSSLTPSEEPSGTNDVTIIEDAEDGTIDGWDIYDGGSNGALITNEYNDTRNSRVIRLSGNGISTGYRLRDDGSSWQNSEQFALEWSMKYSENFIIYVDVKTTEGRRFLCYMPTDYDQVGSNSYIYHGIGKGTKDGQWHTIVRDLQADISEVQTGVEILEVKGFLIRGSGMLDDIFLQYGF